MPNTYEYLPYKWVWKFLCFGSVVAVPSFFEVGKKDKQAQTNSNSKTANGISNFNLSSYAVYEEQGGLRCFSLSTRGILEVCAHPPAYCTGGLQSK